MQTLSRCVKLTFDVVQRYIEVAGLDGNNAVASHRSPVGDGHPVFGLFQHFGFHRRFRVQRHRPCSLVLLCTEILLSLSFYMDGLPDSLRRPGMSICRMPSARRASKMALMTAGGGAATQPPSPAPFTPNGLVRQGSSLNARTKGGNSLARGTA